QSLRFKTVCDSVNLKKFLKIKNIINGVILIAINTFWLWQNLKLAYLYRDRSLAFVMMLPNWLLTLNITFSFIGILIGVQIIRKKINLTKGILINLLLWFLEGMANFFFF